MKPTSRVPGSMRLKLEHEKLLSTFAYNSNLRRYTKVAPGGRIKIELGTHREMIRGNKVRRNSLTSG